MASPIPCKYDSDCPMNEVCYSNVTWRGNGCDCTGYFGFKRNPVTLQCTDYDITAFFTMSYSGILVVGFFQEISNFYKFFFSNLPFFDITWNQFMNDDNKIGYFWYDPSC